MTPKLTRHEQEVYEKLRQQAGIGHDDRLAAGWNAYQNARTDGLCHEGAWEIALAALNARLSEKTSGVDGISQEKKKR